MPVAMPMTTVRLPVCSDTDVYGIAVSLHGSRNSRRRILCLPGLLETRHGFDGLIREARRNAQIFTLDFAGRGDSDHLSGAGSYRMSACLRDACTAYSFALGAAAHLVRPPALQALLPFDMPVPPDASNIHLVGNSMGGLVGVFLAARKPAALRSLIINDVGSLLPWSSLIALFGAIGRASLPSADLRAMTQGGWALAKQLNVDKKLLAAIVQPGYLDLPHQREMAGLSFRQAFQAVDIPVLVIHSADSVIFSKSVRQSMRDLPPNYSFLEIDGSAHPVAYDEAVNAAVLRFIESAERSSLSEPAPDTIALC